MAALMLDNCHTILLSLDSHKSVPAPFLTKSYQLVDDPLTDHIVSWGDDNTTFVVWRPPEFARHLLPKYFKHNNFSSFVRQLNTYGFRKIVPDRWEFANDFFKKGEKHLLSEIHRRKTCQPHQMSQPGFFPYQNPSISPTNSDDQVNNWSCDSPPTLTSPTHLPTSNSLYSTSVTALSEDNERLRRSNNMLMSELAHMRKLYNDIIYFVQNHVKPVAPSNSYPPSLVFPNAGANNVSVVHQKGFNGHQFGNGCDQQDYNYQLNNSTKQGISNGGAKLFGVPLECSKKRSLQHEYIGMSTNKARFVLEKDDLGLNLMPPSPC
ncbi:heat stress transcription factor B-4-like [Apium graveolens]|uniref:heat stress transcription factor B-4-like n=1 Tax=Apium graveolens TaxID=4045 RepID=UPI003D7BD2C9